MFWDKFYTACSYCGKKPNAVADEIGVSSATMTKWKKGATPGSDQIQKIANHFHLPADFFLEIGVFSNWELLLKNKSEVVKFVSISASRISSEMLNYMDDISFAKIAYAFDVHITEHNDGCVGITVTDPISTFPNTDDSKDLLCERRLLSIYNSLSDDDRLILMGKAVELKKMSVISDEPSLKASGN